MLQPRYTIVAIPAFIVLIGYGIYLFRTLVLQLVLLGLFFILSIIHLFISTHYYSTPVKSQIREATSYIVHANRFNFPIVNGKDGWYQQFYLGQFKSDAAMLSGSKNDLIDSLAFSADDKYRSEGMWISGSQGDKPLGGEQLQKLDSNYVLIREKQFYDAYAQLLVKKPFAKAHFAVLNYSDFIDGTVLQEEKKLAIFGGSVHSKPFMLMKGNYDVSIEGNGTSALGEFAHLNIFANNRKIASYYVTKQDSETTVRFTNESDAMTTITIALDNDFYKPPAEDRNAFIRRVIFEKDK
jgi:hypothetical protein